MEDKGNGDMTELQKNINITIPLSLIYRLLYQNTQAHVHTCMHPYISFHNNNISPCLCCHLIFAMVHPHVDSELPHHRGLYVLSQDLWDWFRLWF